MMYKKKRKEIQVHQTEKKQSYHHRQQDHPSRKSDQIYQKVIRISNFSEAAESKINMKICCIYYIYQQLSSETEILKIVYISIKNKYLGKNLIKDVKDLYTENQESQRYYRNI